MRNNRIQTKYALILLILISLFHILIFRQFAPTWDFPHHLLIGLIMLGKTGVPTPLLSVPYGVITDVLPVIIASILPSSLTPSSYLLFAIIAGSAGVIAFYLLLKDTFDQRTALFCGLTVFLLPRFVGHLHTNTKDIAAASFFMMSLYFFNLWISKKRLMTAVLSIITFIISVNAKITALELWPVYLFFSAIYIYLNRKHTMIAHILTDHLLFLFFLPVLSVGTWIILWPHRVISISAAFSYVSEGMTVVPKILFYWPLTQFFVTTPLPVLFFSIFGLYVLWKKFSTEKNYTALVFLFLFFFSILKYILFRLPFKDDIRYFIEIYYPLSLAFVLGLDFVTKKYANYAFAAAAIFLIYVSAAIHPFEINYYNILGRDQDADFWGASYEEVFDYVNKNIPEGAVVSARLAPELANYLIRPDLRADLNSKAPEESDFAVILNRKSYFQIFRVDNFVAKYKPTKVFTMRNGTVLSFFYKLR